MRITAIRDTIAPISSAIANAYIDFSRMTASVVAIQADVGRGGRPLVGFGFNSNGRYAVQGLLRERSVAVGVLDMALWDLRAKAEQKPLWRLLADRYRNGEADPHAWVYAAGGYYYPGKGIDALQDEMRHYRDLGYACVKMKIGGAPLADDLRRIEAVLAVVGSGENL